jgi:hypothetical protein
MSRLIKRAARRNPSSVYGGVAMVAAISLGGFGQTLHLIIGKILTRFRGVASILVCIMIITKITAHCHDTQHSK